MLTPLLLPLSLPPPPLLFPLPVSCLSPSFPLSRHSIHFNWGTLSNAVEFRFEEYANPSDGNFRILPNVVSSYVHALVTPVENFAAAGQTATIVIDINDTAPSSTRTYCANPGSNWNFLNLTTEVRNGNAYCCCSLLCCETGKVEEDKR